ncbi:hypothetical protein GCM10020218_079740 [Dactylosporangium vinaceum]
MAAALSVFPNDALREPIIEDRRDAHPATLRRAVAYSDDNAHRDIAVADIAAPRPSPSAPCSMPSAGTSAPRRPRTCTGCVSSTLIAALGPRPVPSPKSPVVGVFPTAVASVSYQAVYGRPPVLGT